MPSNVTIYSKDNCVQCRATMRYLDKHKVPYDVKSADEHARMLHNKGFNQAPVVVVYGPGGSTLSWSGYNIGRLQNLVDSVVHS